MDKPRPLPDLNAIDNPNDLTRDDIARLQKKHGSEKVNRAIRLAAEAFYKGKKIQ